MKNKEQITVKTIVHSDIETVWNTWTKPEHIEKWNSPSNDWHTPRAENNLTGGGKFVFRMEAKDGSMGFDFGGTYTKVVSKQHLAYTLDDDRKVTVDFKEEDDMIVITETFEAETENSVEMQRDGWKAILDSFKKYTEAL